MIQQFHYWEHAQRKDNQYLKECCYFVHSKNRIAIVSNIWK